MRAGGEHAALIAELRDHLGHRRIECGVRLLDASRASIEALKPETGGSGVVLGLVAQWVDAGYGGPQLLPRLIEGFPAPLRARLSVLDYLHLRMAEGVVAMSSEEFDRAAVHFRFVHSMEDEVDDAELLAIANFWAGRCLRKAGQYDDALEFIVRAEELALSCSYAPMAAVMQVTRSWLVFQRGKLAEAAATLRRAEEALSGTDDYLTRGNIQSAYGRIARRQGRYERALECFEAAIGEYRRGGGGQMQLARTLLNLAFVKRLLALQIHKELDHVSASRRSHSDTGPGAGRIQDGRQQIEQMRAEASGHLAEGRAIYTLRENHRGIAGVHINQGFLRLDAGDLECAAAEAAEAFRHGHAKRDLIIMARARTLECIVENAALDEQVGDAGRHQDAAEAFARDAVHFAAQTQNRRLLARACVWQGLTFIAGPHRDEEAARRCCEEASALLHAGGGERGYVWEDLETLKARLLHASPVDPQLRAWSAGLVQERSFQQMTEEFARIVIPKVWEREGRKVSRVAEKLSISPKKVRRILYAAGLLSRAASGAGPSAG